MTLVVARKTGQRIGIVSDTRLTLHGLPLPIQNGVIKSSILPGGICVSFSNSHERAAKDFHRFMMQYPKGTGFAEVIKFFEKSSADTNNDYIIAFSKNPKIARIVEGRYEKSSSNTLWIGDKEAYERFREYEFKQRKGYENGRAVNAVMFFDPEKSPTSDLYSTMRHVVRDSEIQSVGGFVTCIVRWDDGFRHSTYSDVLYDWPDGEDETYSLNRGDDIDFGVSGENIEESISQISTGYIGLNIVAYYLLKARKVFVFHWASSPIADKCTVISNVEPQDLKAKLGQLWPADLRWLIFINSVPISESAVQLREAISRNQRSERRKGTLYPMLPLVNTLGEKFDGASKEIAFVMPFEPPP